MRPKYEAIFLTLYVDLRSIVDSQPEDSLLNSFPLVRGQICSMLHLRCPDHFLGLGGRHGLSSPSSKVF